MGMRKGALCLSSFNTSRALVAIDLIASLIASALFFPGCFGSDQALYEEILSHRPAEWSSQDCFSVIAIPAAFNHFDQEARVKVIAIPYYPSVILAIQRSAQGVAHWSEESFRANTDTLMADAAGMYIDWEHNGKLVDARGNFFREPVQIDVVQFLIAINNTQWPCNKLKQVAVVTPNGQISYVTVPLMPYTDCFSPDITRLDKNIVLRNDRGETLPAQFVWGRKRDNLTLDETVFAKFQLRKGDTHFLRGSANMFLIIDGFDKQIKLSFPLALMR